MSEATHREDAPRQVERYLALVNAELQTVLGRLDFALLHQAASYTATAAGKRLRPALVCLAADAVGGEGEKVLAAACSVELMHDASLILDDLPCMDNAQLRRDQKAAHLVFGEAQTILSALTLISLSFESLVVNAARCGLDAAATQDLIARVSRAMREAVAGQSMDLLFRGCQPVSMADVEACYRLKTGSVLSVALATGAILARATDAQVATLERFGSQIGVAFQMVDDMFDDSESRIKSGKTTVGRTHGFLSDESIRAARPRILDLLEGSTAMLRGLGSRAEALIATTQWVIRARMHGLQMTAHLDRDTIDPVANKVSGLG